MTLLKGKAGKSLLHEAERHAAREITKNNNLLVQRKFGTISKVHPVHKAMAKVHYASGHPVGGLVDDGEGRWIPIEGWDMFESVFGALRKGMLVVIEWTGETEVSNAYGRVIGLSDERPETKVVLDNDKKVGSFTLMTPGATGGF